MSVDQIESQEQGGGGFGRDEHPLPVVAQAFQAGGELVRQTHAIAEIKTIVSRHEAGMHELSRALGTFRDQTMVPIKKELEFLRYNLGDKANATVSQMQGILGHFHLLYEAILEQAGFDSAGIAAIREKLGIPQNIPSLEQLEAAGRPEVDAAAMQAGMESLVKQNERLIAANQSLLERAERREAQRTEQLEALTARLAQLEAPPDAPVLSPPETP